MPSAPPNSAPVSISEDALPARSTGALPIARSMIWDITVTPPTARTPQDVSTSPIESVPARASSAKPPAAIAKPAVTTCARSTPLRTRAVAAGAAAPIGSDGSSAHRAASSALLSSTDCRYCVVK